MATDAPHACPFCSESHLDRPEQCFRCESPLAAWWPFEDAVQRSRVAVSEAPGTPAVRRGRSLVSLAIAALVGAAAARLWTGAVLVDSPSVSVSTSTTATDVPRLSETAPSATAAAVSPARLSYRVQPGDSLWRVAAALTGDGRNWRTLWPERDPSEPLEVGTVLEVTPEASR